MKSPLFAKHISFDTRLPIYLAPLASAELQRN